MDIVKQIIDQRVNKVIEENPSFFEEFVNDNEKQISLAFLLLGVSAYLDIDMAEVVQYITDGGNDGGFDAAYIAQSGEGILNVVLFQAKYIRNLEKENNFPANAVEKSVNTIKNIFDSSRQMELNDKSRITVDEIRSFLADGVIPYVTFVLINNGIKWNQDAQNHINNEFTSQKQVEFVYFNHQDIIKYVNKRDKIDEILTLSGIAIKEDFNYKEVILGRVSVKEIARILDIYGDNLLDKNIRKYLGINAVNKAIQDTLIDDAKRSNFFFYNNGITMICSDFKYNALQKDDWKVQTKSLQIINGGQTCKTIYQVLKDNSDIDFSDTTVLLRLYAVGSDESVIEGITRATNSQNPVDFRDLKSNDEMQHLLEQGTKELGYTYKRRRDNQTNTDAIPSSVAAESVFAIWRKKPHLAKYKKSEFFNMYYNEIFDDLSAAQMIIAVLIFRMCDSYRKKISDDPGIQAQRRYSHFLIATIIGINVLNHFSISVHQITHKNFFEIKKYFDTNRDELYNTAEQHLLTHLKRYFNKESLEDIDSRTMAAAFRRFDFVESVF
ncbi:MAG: AIPR family protein [Treponema sp.]|nr:AIPR family protein [Treponema sp.]